MRRLVVLVLPLLLAGAPLWAEESEETRVSGFIAEDTVWRDTVRLVGDVTVEAGARLDIVPGTTVLIDAKANPRGGWNDELVEMHVKGKIVADGQLETPITFVGESWLAKPPESCPGRSEQSWLGIVVHPEAKPGSDLRGCIFRGGLAAVQVGRTGVGLHDCVFYRCRTGVGCGILWASPSKMGLRVPTSTPRIEGCRFGDCYVGVTIEGSGRPDIRRCLFFGCDTAVGNERDGLVWQISGLGPFVDRTLFLSCRIALMGSSRLTNSMFVNNNVALLASDFLRHYSDVTDRIVRSHNLFHGNTHVAVGDTSLGAFVVHQDPAFVRPLPRLPNLKVLRGNLPRLFEVRPTSPALGAATDGGDLGPAGAVGTQVTGTTRADVGTSLVLDRWLVPGPPAEGTPRLDAKTVEKLSSRPPKPGQTFRDQTWGLLADDAPGGPASRLLRVGPRVPRVAVAFCRATTRVNASLVMGIDGIARAWWNGEALSLPAERRRYEPDDLRIPIVAKEGRNVLILELEPVARDRRFLCRLAGPRDLRRAPPGLLYDDEAYRARGRKPTSEPLRILQARARRQSRGGSKGYSMSLKLSHHVHWLDRMELERMIEIAMPSGRTVALAGCQTEYKPGTRFLRVHGLLLKPNLAYTVRLLSARAPDGTPLPLNGQAVPLEIR